MDLEQQARELAETWLNGNCSECIRVIVEQAGRAASAHLALLVYDQLVMPQDRKAFKRMLGEKAW